ncbi:DUF917 domain-containing protein [Pyrococcus horikoshii]|uniref:DUF917 domain-containing protein n=1 Tax=Pyrococcus horikoshii TaxID=53953 RepID=A0A832WK24_PYRHR|nr:DUF917 domain-containing protein [Pyrococcus horikoshii]HII61897.1 DUF917 domain-containing protein [Pyrococcus horikoshii]
MRVDEKIAEAAVLGGAFLGGGGGGDIKLGLKHAKLAVEIGEVEIVGVDKIREGFIATVSMVGAPAAKEKYLLPSHAIKSMELFMDVAKVPLSGIISSENGGYSTVNGWIQSAILGIPVVDAPADGRAHPTGVMGALGLHKLPKYVSIQTAVGGSRERYVEVIVKGSLERAAKLVREAAVQAGGLVAVTRNPVTPDYVKENAAVGAISQAIEIGKVILDHKNEVDAMLEKIFKVIGGGRVVDNGVIEKVKLETKGGFDIGRVIIKGKETYEITFWNEFMTLEDSSGKRYATFPDLIVLINQNTGLPMTSAEVKEGDKVVIATVPKDLLLLGSGVKDPEVLKQVEEVVGKKIL